MFSITLITMGKLKETFYISAAEEYKKRLGGYCAFTLLELPEARLPENPSPGEIEAGLEKEAELIFSKIPKGSWFCVLTPEADRLLAAAYERMGLSGRSYDRLLRVARTIADLAGSEMIGPDHVAEAIQFRNLDRKYWQVSAKEL